MILISISTRRCCLVLFFAFVVALAAFAVRTVLLRHIQRQGRWTFPTAIDTRDGTIGSLVIETKHVSTQTRGTGFGNSQGRCYSYSTIGSVGSSAKKVEANTAR